MNTYLKGRLAEKWLEDYFCSQGIWNVQTSYRAPHVKFKANTDIFNTFDGVAIDLKTQNIILWQLKSNKSDYYTFKTRIKEFKAKFIMDNDSIKPILYLKEKNENGWFLRSYEVYVEVGADGTGVVKGFERIVPLKLTKKGMDEPPKSIKQLAKKINKKATEKFTSEKALSIIEKDRLRDNL